MQIIAFLHSDDGLTTPQLDTLVLDYDFAGPAASVIDKCIVFGTNIDSLGAADTNTFTIKLTEDAVMYKTDILIQQSTITVTPDSEGYWEAELVESANMTSQKTGNKVRYTFDFGPDDSGGDRIITRSVPNESSKNIWDLVE